MATFRALATLSPILVLAPSACAFADDYRSEVQLIADRTDPDGDLPHINHFTAVGTYYLDTTFSVGAGFDSGGDTFRLRSQKFFTPSFAVGRRFPPATMATASGPASGGVSEFPTNGA